MKQIIVDTSNSLKCFHSEKNAEDNVTQKYRQNKTMVV